MTGCFSLLKSKLRKLEGLKYNELKENIKKVIKDIPKKYKFKANNNYYNKKDKMDNVDKQY